MITHLCDHYISQTTTPLTALYCKFLKSSLSHLFYYNITLTEPTKTSISIPASYRQIQLCFIREARIWETDTQSTRKQCNCLCNQLILKTNGKSDNLLCSWVKTCYSCTSNSWNLITTLFMGTISEWFWVPFQNGFWVPFQNGFVVPPPNDIWGTFSECFWVPFQNVYQVLVLKLLLPLLLLLLRLLILLWMDLVWLVLLK